MLELGEPSAVGIEPLAEPRPVRQQGLVSYLDDRFPRGQVTVSDQQASADEPIGDKMVRLGQLPEASSTSGVGRAVAW